MDNSIARLFRDAENGKISRRQLIQALGLSAAAAFSANAAVKAAAFAASATQTGAAGGKVFPLTTVQHISYAVADYVRSRDFYVDLFGMQVVWDNGKGCDIRFGPGTEHGMYIRAVTKPGDKAVVNHIAWGVPNFMKYKTEMKAEMDRRGLANIRPDGEHGWICDDPSGYMLNIVAAERDAAMFPGAASPCEVADSVKCQDAYADGLKNLSSIPKASGKGFRAVGCSSLVFNVFDTDKEAAFYRDMFGMKVIYSEPNTGRRFLKFGQNGLILRKTVEPKGSCDHFGFIIENYDSAKVEAELKRRGLNPQPNSKLGWMFRDPDGFSIEVAGPGLLEHLANDCKGNAATCPGGTRG